MDAQRDYLLAWGAVTRMLAEGRSLSGRERNNCFLNIGPASGGCVQFADVSALSGFDYADDARSLGLIDWDFDGDLDLWVRNRTGPQLRFLRNQIPDTGRFLALKLQGVSSNRDAIGARVEVRLAGQTPARRIRTVKAGEGYLSQSTKWLHFGLGNANQIERLVVDWPGGDRTEYRDLRMDRFYLIRQDRPGVELWQPPAVDSLATADPVPPATPLEEPKTTTIRVVMAARPVLPDVMVEPPNGPAVPLALPSGRPVLLNLWALWCQPCLNELAEFADQHERLKRAGLDVIALNVTGPDETPWRQHAAKVEEFLQSIEFPFTHWMLPSPMAAQLNTFQRACMSLQEPMPMPTSFLLDEQGLVAVIYKGPVSVKQLDADVQQLSTEPALRRDHAAPFPGRWALPPVGSDPVRLALKQLDDGSRQFAIDYLTKHLEAVKRGNVPEADPKSGVRQRAPSQVIYTRGKLYQQDGQLAAAAEDYRTALEHDADNARARIALGHLLLDHGSADEAAEQLRLAVEQRSHDADVRCLLSLAEFRRGNAQQAAHEGREAIAMDPQNVTAHYALGLACQATGDVQQAVSSYRRVLELAPNWQMARNNLAWLLATSTPAHVRNGAEAVRLIEPLCQSHDQANPLFLRTLAAAYAEAGEFQRAVATADAALRRLVATHVASLEPSLRAERRKYVARQPHRE